MLTANQEEQIVKELSYQTSRSGGKGGQNVNKVESKVEVSLDIRNSLVLNDEQKAMIIERAGLAEGDLLKAVSSVHRSQIENKEEARKKLVALINRFLKVVKKRKPTKKSKSSKLKVLEQKKKQSDKKSLRRKDW
jgi:ribosome-associated protein